ncbi:heme-degrading domain-containing protein [Oerskovia sp. KBS0722]|uniref:heme-degrading domain-containing protein n=1 Tax=Oerskovia sp. KBS0722 TaxID=1179673 RepID=UPI00110DBB82|nr:heme-degrading domain-containing protein [Oerskovia sp. KBS0722]QDW63784.1 heme-degrading domain-containing protein [Oerskovia sp. KBS0722]
MTHEQPESPDLARTARFIAEAEQHERDLVLTRFTHDDAWRLGCLLVELAAERSLPITIDVRRGPQQVFHAATEGTTPDNDTWVQRKVRVVERFGASSYLMGLRAKAKGTTFTAQHELAFQEYAAHGGAFPLRVEGVGVIGVVTVSGLAQRDDHLLVVEALETFLRTAA